MDTFSEGDSVFVQGNDNDSFRLCAIQDTNAVIQNEEDKSFQIIHMALLQKKEIILNVGDRVTCRDEGEENTYKVVSIHHNSKQIAIQSLVDVNAYKLVLKSSLAKILYPSQAAEEAVPHNAGIAVDGCSHLDFLKEINNSYETISAIDWPVLMEGPPIEELRRKYKPHCSEAFLWKKKTLNYPRNRVRNFLSRNMDDIFLAPTGVKSSDERDYNFFKTTFCGSVVPLRLPITNLAKLKESIDFSGHGPPKYNNNIIHYVASQIMTDPPFLKVTGLHSVKLPQYIRQWKAEGKSTDMMKEQIDQNRIELQNCKKKQKCQYERIKYLKQKFVKSFKTGDIIHFATCEGGIQKQHTALFSTCEEENDNSILLYYIKKLPSDEIADFNSLLFVNDEDYEYKKWINFEIKHNKKGWLCSKQKNTRPKDFSVTQINNFTKKHIMFSTNSAKINPQLANNFKSLNTERYYQIISLHKSFFFLLNVRRGNLLPPLQSDIIDKLKNMPSDVINEVLLHHHNYFCLLDLRKDYHRVLPVVQTFKQMVSALLRDLGTIINGCRTEMKQLFYDGGHQQSTYETLRGPSILWVPFTLLVGKDVGKIQNEINDLFKVFSPSFSDKTISWNDRKPMLMFLQAICAGTVFKQNQFGLLLTCFDLNLKKDSLLRPLQLFCFEFEFPDIGELHVSQEKKSTVQDIQLLYKSRLYQKLSSFVSNTKYLCHVSVKNQRVKSIAHS